MHTLEKQMLDNFNVSKDKLSKSSNFIISDIVGKSLNLLNSYKDLEGKNSGIVINQFSLHIPQLGLQDIYSNIDDISNLYQLPTLALKEDSIRIVIDKIIPKIENIYSAYMNKYDVIKMNEQYKNSKIKLINGHIFCELGNGILEELYFGEICEEDGKYIQNNLHYIQNFRKDGIAHLGILNSRGDTLAYCSFSILDRDYPLVAFPDGIKKEEILNMTRAFGIENAPKNLMSTLYTQAYKYINMNHNSIKYIMTYINQNLLFQGSSFKGSSYIAKGTSPMEYLYVDGIYKNRKGIEETSQPNRNKLFCLPIVLLLRGTNKRRQKEIENNYSMVNISQKDYSNG